MSKKMQVDFRVLNGPNLLAPFAAVVAEFSSRFPAPLSADQATSQLTKLLPEKFRQQLVLTPGEVAFENLAASLANALQDLAGQCGLSVVAKRTDSGICQIILGFVDPHAARHALVVGLEIAILLFNLTDGGPARTQAIADMIRNAESEMRLRQPDFIARSMMRIARSRKIPVYPVSHGSRIWQYGQGSAGSHFFEAANHRDSLTGNILQRDKFLSNQLLKGLGLPGVRHGIASDVGQALRIAGQLGFPVVAKPIDRGKGKGVTANIDNADLLAAAFAKARQFSPRGVIVERHIPGDDHRIAVIGGRLAWVVQRLPPRILGDGQRTISELIDLENSRRSDEDVVAGFSNRLVVDADMLAVLARQKLSPQDLPAKGRLVQLRSIANLATGGTWSDCTADIHPDNRDMAETIARGFRLDSMGIDFITTDIARSWSEGGCGVIEVNAMPGISSDFHAELILRHGFRDYVDGRIPSVVLIGADWSSGERVTGVMRSSGRRVGQTDAKLTLMAGRLFSADTGELPARVMALLLDPSCEALVIGAAPTDIERHGFPLDRCNLALIAEGVKLSAPMRDLIEKCADRVINEVNSQNLEPLAFSTITQVLADAGWCIRK